ncbi:MAG: GNAT family N-acetyltransferase [Terriglobales bacterium]
MFIETERLILRPFTEEDLPSLAALYADPVVMRYYPQTYNVDETQERLNITLEAYKSVGYHLLATILKAENKFIGRCGIVRQTVESEQLPEIGYMLDKDYWGKGYATEAARALRDFGFTNFDFGALYSLIRPINTPSQAVAGRMGMTLAKVVSYGGYEHNLNCITRDRWKQLRPPLRTAATTT